MTKEETDALILSHRVYAETVAYNMVRNNTAYVAWLGQFADLRQEVQLTVIRAAYYYDPSKGASFKTYLTQCIWNNIRQMMDRMNTADRKKFLYAERLDDTVEPVKQTPWGIDSVMDAAMLLSTRDQALLVRVHIDGWTYQRYADMIGVSKQYIEQLHTRALAKLKKIVLQKQERLDGK